MFEYLCELVNIHFFTSSVEMNVKQASLGHLTCVVNMLK